MKKLYLLVAALLLCTTAIHAQKAKAFGPIKAACHFDQQLNRVLRDNPGAQLEIDGREAAIQQYIKTTGLQKSGSEIIIPVYIKVIYASSTGPENISDDQIMSQLNALNTYFEPYNIKFCLSRRDVSGNLFPGTIPGIYRLSNSGLSTLDVNTELNSLNSSPGGYSMPSSQLNIYIVKDIIDNGQSGTVVGLGSMPGYSTGFDGIVMRYDAFGDINDPLCTSCTLDPSSNQGKILVHEVGHYLGLYHTFMDGCLEVNGGDCQTMGDRVCDTPPVAQQNNGCPVGINTCNESPNLPDDINNYMDYTNESCLNSFSNGQKNRMLATLQLYRFQLISTENLAARGIACINPLLLTSFTAPSYSTCTAGSITFTGATVSGATYSWNFGDPASGPSNTSSLQVASHTFNTAGEYTVTLTLTIGAESVSVSKQVYIVSCTPINTEPNWLFSNRNAFSFQTGVPVQSTITNLSSSHTFHESCAIQHDANGQILFYTNGIRVFNASQTSVNEGNLLRGNTSSNDGALIVPDPAAANTYYVFTKAAEGGLDGFRFTKVTMSGSTPVLSSINTPITFPAGYLTGNDGAIRGTEGIIAIQNCTGYWIITGLRKTETTHFTVVYSLDSTGLHYVSEIETPSGSLYQNSYKASPNGNYVLTGIRSTPALMDFNKNTGVLSNLRPLGNATYNLNGTSGACFSPNSKYIYIPAGNYMRLFQFDVTLPDLVAGREEIGMPMLSTGQMQLGPDNKIYFTKYDMTTLAVIHSPNSKITANNPNACQFSLDGPTTQTQATLALPNVIVAKTATVYNNTISFNAISCLQYRFIANSCATSFSWNFGDPTTGAGNTSSLANPSHTFSGPGVYTVTVMAGSTQMQVQVTVGGTAPVISGSTQACEETANQTSHSTQVDNTLTLQWSIVSGSGSFTGPANYPGVTVAWTSLPGTIRLTVTDANGCVNTTDQVIIQDCGQGENCPASYTFTTPMPVAANTYNASDFILVQDDYTVLPGADVDLFAGKVIVMKKNSWIRNGSDFLAAITPCPQQRSLLGSEEMQQAKLVAYPNPTKGLLQLSGKPIKEVTIFDIIGKEVYHSGYDNVTQATIDMSALLKGLYLVRVVTDTDEVESIKIIKE